MSDSVLMCFYCRNEATVITQCLNVRYRPCCNNHLEGHTVIAAVVPSDAMVATVKCSNRTILTFLLRVFTRSQLRLYAKVRDIPRGRDKEETICNIVNAGKVKGITVCLHK